MGVLHIFMSRPLVKTCFCSCVLYCRVFDPFVSFDAVKVVWCQIVEAFLNQQYVPYIP